MKHNLIITFLFLFSYATFHAMAQSHADIEKVWYNTKKTAKISIYKNGNTYEGKIVWLKTPKNEEGKDKVDKHNPDRSLQQRPIFGLVLLRGFKADGNGHYSGGKIYDPENGKTYSCKMELIDSKNLDVRGYIGISLLGRTEHWTAAL
ncbi:MAG: DUF2147 domain-containing protein [Bacteroidetes bacterium]|nr:DUF2147 domain-containing protein [Bacteroidota bacterium]